MNTRAPYDGGAPTNSADTDWAQLSTAQQAVSLANIDVYLGNFISSIQGWPTECSQSLRHLFHMMEHVFRLNTDNNTHCKHPISLKKIM